MKRKIVLITLFAAVGIQQIQAAAPLSWMRGKLQAGVQKTRETVKVKYREVLQKLQSFQSYLNEQGGCILSGTCPPEVKQSLVQRAKILGAALAALAVLLGAAYFFSPEQEAPPIEITQTTGTQATEVGGILKKWAVKITQDDSLPALFIKAATNGAQSIIKQVYDLVPKNVLEAGKEIAQERMKSQPTIYGQILTTVKIAINSFNLSKLRNNLAFIRKANTGLDEEIKVSVCSSNPPSQNAIAEALELIKNKVGYTFERIRQFLKNPVCKF